jgi:hypothetical protein
MEGRFLVTGLNPAESVIPKVPLSVVASIFSSPVLDKNGGSVTSPF